MKDFLQSKAQYQHPLIEIKLLQCVNILTLSDPSIDPDADGVVEDNFWD